MSHGEGTGRAGYRRVAGEESLHIASSAPVAKQSHGTSAFEPIVGLSLGPCKGKREK